MLMRHQSLKTPDFDWLICLIAVSLAGLLFPIFLIPLITFTGQSVLAEELAKLAVVLILLNKMPRGKHLLIAAALFGALFGLSENLLYLNQLFRVADMASFALRFVTTLPMHMLTVLVMTVSGLKRQPFIVPGFLLALALHLLFNHAVTILGL